MILVASDMNFNDMGGLLLFILHSLFTVTGLFILKISVSEFSKFNSNSLIELLTFKLFLGLSFYITAFIISLIILNKYPLGVSVSIMMPLSLLISVLFGYMFLNENISIQIIVGLGLLLAGIFTIYYGKT